MAAPLLRKGIPLLRLRLQRTTFLQLESHRLLVVLGALLQSRLGSKRRWPPRRRAVRCLA
ncbi:hypothetical protein Gotur_007575 [Gossypium turneri]